MYNKGVQTNSVFMPRKSTVSKSIATAPKAPRKTRTRKTATVKTVTSPTVKPAPVVKPVAKKVIVTTFQGGKVIAKKTTLKRPGTSKLITPQRYMADIATRWAIHNYEIQVDSMDTKTMMEWITDELIYQYGKLSPDELKERVDCYDSELYDELVDNVTNDTLVDPKEYSWGKETVN